MLRPAVLGLALVAAFARAPAPAKAAEILVTIEKLTFSPVEIAAHPGDTIRWINKDFVAHTATAKDKSFDIMLPAHGEGTLVVQSAGAINYFCRFHPMMKGTITVGP
jgi:plastocyanin